jgi:hypothetical protein
MKPAEAIIFMMGCINPEECRQSILDAYNDIDKQTIVMSNKKNEYQTENLQLSLVDKKE